MTTPTLSTAERVIGIFAEMAPHLSEDDRYLAGGLAEGVLRARISGRPITMRIRWINGATMVIMVTPDGEVEVVRTGGDVTAELTVPARIEPGYEYPVTVPITEIEGETTLVPTGPQAPFDLSKVVEEARRLAADHPLRKALEGEVRAISAEDLRTLTPRWLRLRRSVGGAHGRR